MVRANRYALAAAMNGKALEPWVRALRGCDNPACVRASLRGEIGLLHIIRGSQRDNTSDDGAGPPRRRAGPGAPRRSRSQGAPRPGGGATRSGTPRMGRRSCRGGAAGLNRPDPVVSRTATTQSGHRRACQRRRNRGERSRRAERRRRPLMRSRSAGGGQVVRRCRSAALPPDRAEGAGLVTARARRPATEPNSEVANVWRAAASKPPGRVPREEKRGPANPAGCSASRAPVSQWRTYSVCSKRNAWALSDPLPAAAVRVRNARAVLASLAVRAPRTGTTWSRNSVTAL